MEIIWLSGMGSNISAAINEWEMVEHNTGINRASGYSPPGTQFYSEAMDVENGTPHVSYYGLGGGNWTIEQMFDGGLDMYGATVSATTQFYGSSTVPEAKSYYTTRIGLDLGASYQIGMIGLGVGSDFDVVLPRRVRIYQSPVLPDISYYDNTLKVTGLTNVLDVTYSPPVGNESQLYAVYYVPTQVVVQQGLGS